LKAKQDAELAAKQEADRKEKERIMAEKKAVKDPDKVKLNNWVDSFIIPEISLKENDSNEIADSIQAKFNAFKSWAKTQIEAL
jgi:hypothetical protein